MQHHTDGGVNGIPGHVARQMIPTAISGYMTMPRMFVSCKTFPRSTAPSSDVLLHVVDTRQTLKRCQNTQYLRQINLVTVCYECVPCAKMQLSARVTG